MGTTENELMLVVVDSKGNEMMRCVPQDPTWRTSRAMEQGIDDDDAYDVLETARHDVWYDDTYIMFYEVDGEVYEPSKQEFVWNDSDDALTTYLDIYG